MRLRRKTIVKPRRRKCVFRSSLEDRIIAELTALNVQFTYETMKLKYVVPAKHHTYTPDIILGNGIIVEIKGYLDLESRKKMQLVIEQHPELDIRFVFQKANKPITKCSKTTYSDWCDKLKIKWAEGLIPQEWIDELPKNGRPRESTVVL